MVIELENLTTVPCDEWRLRFDKKGKLNVHLAFIEHGQQYRWLYKHSNYDLIGWQIKNGVFNWEEHSQFLAENCPRHLNKEKYNWKDFSWAVAKYCPRLTDHEFFNPEQTAWEDHSWAVAETMQCPDSFDKAVFNWKRDVETELFEDTSFKGTWANDTLIYGLLGGQTGTPS